MEPMTKNLLELVIGRSLATSVEAVPTPVAGGSRVTTSSRVSESCGVETILLGRAEKDTDLSNLRRRQVQEKVYIRWGEP